MNKEQKPSPYKFDINNSVVLNIGPVEPIYHVIAGIEAVSAQLDWLIRNRDE